MAAEHNTGVYEIRNVVNGKRYVGSAVSFRNRWRNHVQSLNRGDHHSRALQRAWNRYGPGAFHFNKLLACDKENLIMYEQACMDALKPEYNCAPRAGSQLGFKHPPEARARMSASRRKDFSPMTGKTHTDEAKAKISASRRGKGGGPMSAERRAKIGAAHKGRVISPERRAKISESLMGHKQTPEQIEKRAQKLRGRKMPEGFAQSARLRMLGTKVAPSSVLKGRKTRARFTDEQILEIQSRLRMKETQASIASLFGVHQSVISEIKSGKTYSWVGDSL